jgi:hypothetical protein
VSLAEESLRFLLAHAQSPPLASRLCATIDGAPTCGAFASGSDSGFAWVDAPEASFFNDAHRGVAVALFSAPAAANGSAGLPPLPAKRSRAPPDAPVGGEPAAEDAATAPCVRAEELAALYFSLSETAVPDDVAAAAEAAAEDVIAPTVTVEDVASPPSAEQEGAAGYRVAEPASDSELESGDTTNHARTTASWAAKAAALTRLRGAFAFVIHDAARNTVLAARDAAGGAPLFWAAAPDGALLLSTSLRSGLSEAGAPTATAFPPGCLFLAAGGAHPAQCPGPRGFTLPGAGRPCALPGALRSFTRPAAPVRAIPRISSRGVLCGAVFRVASAGDMAGDAGARAA